MHILHEAGKVDEPTVNIVKTYLSDSRLSVPSDRVPAFLGKIFPSFHDKIVTHYVTALIYYFYLSPIRCEADNT